MRLVVSLKPASTLTFDQRRELLGTKIAHIQIDQEEDIIAVPIGVLTAFCSTVRNQVARGQVSDTIGIWDVDARSIEQLCKWMKSACSQDPIPAINSKLPINQFVYAAETLGMDFSLLQMKLLIESHLAGKNLDQAVTFWIEAEDWECPYVSRMTLEHISDSDFLRQHSVHSRLSTMQAMSSPRGKPIRLALARHFADVRRVDEVDTLIEQCGLQQRFVLSAIRETAECLYNRYQPGDVAHCEELMDRRISEQTRQLIRAELAKLWREKQS